MCRPPSAGGPSRPCCGAGASRGRSPAGCTCSGPSAPPSRPPRPRGAAPPSPALEVAAAEAPAGAGQRGGGGGRSGRGPGRGGEGRGGLQTRRCRILYAPTPGASAGRSLTRGRERGRGCAGPARGGAGKRQQRGESRRGESASPPLRGVHGAAGRARRPPRRQVRREAAARTTLSEISSLTMYIRAAAKTDCVILVVMPV